MNLPNIKICSVLVTGFKDINRGQLRNEFDKFGQITKLYIDERGRFAKVYYADTQPCYLAVDYLNNNNQFGWKLFYSEDRATFLSLEATLRDDIEGQTMSDSYAYASDEMTTESYDYCNVHGDPLPVLQADSGDMYVNVKDVRKTGFAIFRIDTFNPVLTDQRQILKEFDLHLLSEAKNYILQNHVRCIDEESILRTIDNCKSRLLQVQQRSSHDYNTKVSVTGITRSFRDNTENRDYDANRSFGENRGRQPYRDQRQDNRDNRRQDYHRERSQGRQDYHRERSQGRRDSRNSYQNQPPSGQFTDFAQPMRPPRNLPSNFMPTNRQSTPRPKREYSNEQSNGFDRGSQEFQIKTSNAPSHAKKRMESSVSSSSSEGKNKSAKSYEEEKIPKVEMEVGKKYEVKVCYTEPEKDNICWVRLAESADDMDTIMLEIYEAQDDIEEIQHPSKGQLVLGLFDEVWCRGRIVNPATKTVQFLDYGNVSVSDSVKQLPDKLKKTPALATRLVVNRNTEILVEDAEFCVDVRKRYDDDTVLVNLIQSVDSSHPDKLERSAKQHSEESLDSNLKAKEPENPVPKAVETPKPILKPARLVVETPKPVIETPKQIVESPKPVAETPKPVVETPKPVVETPKQEERSVSPAEVGKKDFFVKPKPLMVLKDGDVIKLFELEGGKLYVKTKECVEKTKEINVHIRELNKSELVLSSVKEGQLVLCSRDGLAGLCRAVVKAKQDGIMATVQYVDYPGEDNLSLKSLRNVDMWLAEQPATLLVTPKLAMFGKLGGRGRDFVTELVGRKERVTVVISEDDEMDFLLEDKRLLTKVLLSFSKPASTESPRLDSTKEEKKAARVKAEDAPPTSKASDSFKESPANTQAALPTSSYTIVTIDDMTYLEMAVGSDEHCLCHCVEDVNYVTLMPIREDSLAYLQDVLSIKVDDDTPYDPEMLEMCLAAYQGPGDTEGSWNRGLVIGTENGAYELLLVDFGNKVIIRSDHIRRFPPNLKEMPILGLPCVLEGLKNTEEVNKEIRSLEQEQLLTTVKRFDEETYKYDVVFPKVYEKLRKAGLCE